MQKNYYKNITEQMILASTLDAYFLIISKIQPATLRIQQFKIP